MKRDTILSVVCLISLAVAGIVAMVLGAIYNLEWCKNIAFLLFGTATSPLHSTVQAIRLGTHSSTKQNITKCFIGAILGLSLSMFACAATQDTEQINCITNASVKCASKCYDYYAECFEIPDIEVYNQCIEDINATSNDRDSD